MLLATSVCHGKESSMLVLWRRAHLPEKQTTEQRSAAAGPTALVGALKLLVAQQWQPSIMACIAESMHAGTTVLTGAAATPACVLCTLQ